MIEMNTTATTHAPPPLNWRDKLDACEQQKHWLSTKERAFVFSLRRWRGTPTEKQLAWLDHIYENLP
jgi:hypothetical protein